MKLAFPVATPDTCDESMLALRGEMAERFRLLHQLGYQGAELMARTPRELDTARVRAVAAEFNLALVGVSTGQLRKEDGLQLCHADRAERERAVDRTKEVIDFAREVGAPQVNIGTLRGRLPNSELREERKCLEVCP